MQLPFYSKCRLRTPPRRSDPAASSLLQVSRLRKHPNTSIHTPHTLNPPDSYRDPEKSFMTVRFSHFYSTPAFYHKNSFCPSQTAVPPLCRRSSLRGALHSGVSGMRRSNLAITQLARLPQPMPTHQAVPWASQ